MNKLLISSTALMGMVVSAPALADMTTSFGMNVGIAVISDDGQTPQDRSVQTQQDFEIAFKASTELDNGLTTYAGVEMDAQGSGSVNIKFDDVVVGVKGSFGDVRFGNFAADALVIKNPVPYNGTNDDKLSVSTPGTVDGITGGDYSSIGYSSPSVMGFTLGVSYHGGMSDVGDTQGTDVVNADEEQAGVGLSYKGDFGGASLSAGISLVQGMSYDERQINTGAKVGFSGFSVSAAYLDVSGDEIEGTTGAAEYNIYAVGAGYATGPWSIDVAYTKEDVTDAAINASSFGGIAKYNVGPGLSVYGAYEMTEEGANDGSVGTIGASFKF